MDTQVAVLLASMALVMTTVMAQQTGGPKEVNSPAVAVADTGSRNLIGEEKAKWIEEMSGKLTIARRAVGPFGIAQNPEAEAAKPQKVKLKKGAFIEAIAAIKINTVMPMDDKFTIGSREFVEGDQFPLIKERRQFNIEVVSVKSDGILFKDVDSGKLVKKSLESLPAGMARGSSLKTIPGVFSANRENSMPLNLDDVPLPITNE